MSTTTTTPPPQDAWQAKELGVLWARVKKGTTEKYLVGTFNLKNAGGPDKDVPVIIFQNKKKQKDAHPDLRIYISEKPSAPAAGAAPAAARPAAPKAAPAAPVAKPVQAADNELI